MELGARHPWLSAEELPMPGKKSCVGVWGASPRNYKSSRTWSIPKLLIEHSLT